MDSPTIKEFLRTHDFISPNAVEKLLKIPTGTIRISGDRPIPAKHVKMIAMVLREYGLKNE